MANSINDMSNNSNEEVDFNDIYSIIEVYKADKGFLQFEKTI